MHYTIHEAIEAITREWDYALTPDVDAQAAGSDRLDKELDALCELQALVQDADILSADIPIEYVVTLVRELDSAGWIVGGLDLETPILQAQIAAQHTAARLAGYH